MKLRRLMLAVLALSPIATFAQDAAQTAGSDPFRSLAAAFAIGVAALGGALGQGRTAATALEGIARNPSAQSKIFVPMIIGLALIESLVIYALLIAFQLV